MASLTEIGWREVAAEEEGWATFASPMPTPSTRVIESSHDSLSVCVGWHKIWRQLRFLSLGFFFFFFFWEKNKMDLAWCSQNVGFTTMNVIGLLYFHEDLIDLVPILVTDSFFSPTLYGKGSEVDGRKMVVVNLAWRWER